MAELVSRSPSTRATPPLVGWGSRRPRLWERPSESPCSPPARLAHRCLHARHGGLACARGAVAAQCRDGASPAGPRGSSVTGYRLRALSLLPPLPNLPTERGRGLYGAALRPWSLDPLGHVGLSGRWGFIVSRGVSRTGKDGLERCRRARGSRFLTRRSALGGKGPCLLLVGPSAVTHVPVAEWGPSGPVSAWSRGSGGRPPVSTCALLGFSKPTQDAQVGR